MAYYKKEKYVPYEDVSTKEDLLNIFINEKGMPSHQARRMVYYPTPMSLVRWSKYLTPYQIEKYLHIDGDERVREVEVKDNNLLLDDIGI